MQSKIYGLYTVKCLQGHEIIKEINRSIPVDMKETTYCHFDLTEREAEFRDVIKYRTSYVSCYYLFGIVRCATGYEIPFLHYVHASCRRGLQMSPGL